MFSRIRLHPLKFFFFYILRINTNLVDPAHLKPATVDIFILSTPAFPFILKNARLITEYNVAY